jgi:protein-S-isoprenylcysteine O-methyltransferase Ste14
MTEVQLITVGVAAIIGGAVSALAGGGTRCDSTTLGSWWTLLLFPAFMPILVARILNEEKGTDTD